MHRFESLHVKRTFSTAFLLPALLTTCLTACDFERVPNFYPEQGFTDHPQEMRDFVGGLRGYAQGLKPGFVIVGQGALPLVSANERKPRRSETKRPINSALRCWASAALPPLPHQ